MQSVIQVDKCDEFISNRREFKTFLSPTKIAFWVNFERLLLDRISAKML